MFRILLDLLLYIITPANIYIFLSHVKRKFTIFASARFILVTALHRQQLFLSARVHTCRVRSNLHALKNETNISVIISNGAALINVENVLPLVYSSRTNGTKSLIKKNLLLLFWRARESCFVIIIESFEYSHST